MTSPPIIRVLIAEDSPTARALLVGMLSAASGLEVIGQASNGIDAVEMTKRLRPDVVTMDIQMPGLDGFEATKRIMNEMPTPIVIISSLDVHSVQFSMEALNAGALAVLPKPVGPASPAYEATSRLVASTVRSMSQVKLVRRWPSAPPYKPQSSAAPSAAVRSLRPRAVTIAASTGGPPRCGCSFRSWIPRSRFPYSRCNTWRSASQTASRTGSTAALPCACGSRGRASRCVLATCTWRPTTNTSRSPIVRPCSCPTVPPWAAIDRPAPRSSSRRRGHLAQRP